MEILRGNAVVADITIDEKTTFAHRLMNENEISVDIISDTVLPIQIGDHIVWKDELYFLNRLPDSKKKNLNTFEYKMEFQGLIYSMYNQLLFSSDGLTDFSYTAQAYEFLQLIVDSMNEIDPGWTVGAVDASDDLNVDFAGDSCRTALTKIAEAFKFEFSLIGKEITLKKTVGSVTNNSFEYGKGKGLYTLTREQVADQNICTRVFGFGGTQNITEEYRNRAKKLIFETGGKKYLEKNVNLYGLKVGRYINEEIYPKRTGTLTDASFLFVSDKFDNIHSFIEDTAIDFDLNGNKIEGSTPKVVFKTGDLSGNEFEVWKYDHATKRMYLNPYSEPDGYTMPNDMNHAHTGDTYTLIGIKLPQAYVDAAEAELQAATQTYLNENSVPQVIYSLEIDPKYVKLQSINLKVGDIVHVKDVDLGVDNDIRVAEISYPLVTPYKIKATIADFVPYTEQQIAFKNAIQAPKQIKTVSRKSAELARIATQRQQQLKDLIFDPDGYFDPTRIKPLSIETMYLKVGAKSQNLKLSGITFTPNYNGDENSFDVTGGNIIHLQYSIPAGNTWDMAANLFGNLVSDKAYYLYAKCSKAQLTGAWELTPEQKQFEDADFYYFWTGVLYTVLNGLREFEPTTGMITMNAGNITAGRLQSIDGTQFFELDNMKFFVGDADGSIDYNVTRPKKVSVHGAIMTDVLISSFIGAENLTVEHLKTGDSPNIRFEINRFISALLGNSNAIEGFDQDNALAILISNIAGADDNFSHSKVGWMQTIKAGLMVQKGTEVSKMSKNGFYAKGGGYMFILPDGRVGRAAGVFQATGGESVEDIYAGGYSSASFVHQVPTFAHVFDGMTLATGTHIAKSFTMSQSSWSNVSNNATANMLTGYNLYTNKNSTQNQNWYLPDPAVYEIGEEIEIVNWNDFDIYVRVQNGDFLNGYDSTQKQIQMLNASDCCKLRSDGVNTWIIVSLKGNLVTI